MQNITIMDDSELKALKHRYGIMGNNTELNLALIRALKVAPTNLSILINGESGVGKDVFSRIIHENSSRKHVKSGKGLISVNCGAIPEGTMESELFGHVKGSFTGADSNRKGYFEEANGGTIFLDEVGELSQKVQVRLLRVLENGEITPVGASTPVKVDVRVVAATNVNLTEAIRKGKFREDLYYRLNQVSVVIPPLRDRQDDIPQLFMYFTNQISQKYKITPKILDSDAKEYLKEYSWPGNIRELKNVAEQVTILEDHPTISKAILMSYISFVPNEKMPTLYNNEEMGISKRDLLMQNMELGRALQQLRAEFDQLKTTLQESLQMVPNPTPIPHTDALIATPSSKPKNNGIAESISSWLSSKNNPIDEDIVEPTIIDSPVPLAEREKDDILKALQRNNGNRKLAALELGISERTLYRKIKNYDL